MSTTQERDPEKVESEAISSTGSQKDYCPTDDDVAKEQIWRKLDAHLLPLATLLYLLSFL